MQQLYIERENGVNGNAEVEDPMFADLRRALERHRLGLAATAFGQELIAIVDLEHGLWSGRPVDVPTIDALFAAHDEKTLRRFADRLPTPHLRDEARRRVVRIHIAASPFHEVRDHAAAVEEIVMKQRRQHAVARRAPAGARLARHGQDAGARRDRPPGRVASRRRSCSPTAAIARGCRCCPR